MATRRYNVLIHQDVSTRYASELGLLLFVVVCAACIADSDGAEYILHETEGRFPRLRTILVDQGYSSWLIDFAARWLE